MGVVKTCGSFTEMKKPEVAFKCFIRFVLAQAAVSWGMELMTGAFRVAQGMVTTIMDSSGLTAMSASALPDEMTSIIEDVGFVDSIPLWAVTLLGSLFIWVLSLVMILTVYSRFFKLYIATAIAPVPLASFAGQPSSSIGVAFLKSYAAICLEGCVIVLACVIFSAFASSPPASRTIRWRQHHRMELCGRADLQYAGAGGRDQDERPHHPGADGPWLIQRHRPSVLTVSSPFSRALRTR